MTQIYVINCLFDRETLDMTALIDWHFAHPAAPISEFLHSFQDFHALLESNCNLENDEILLQKYQLTSFPAALPVARMIVNSQPEPGESASIDWPKAKRFDDALSQAGVSKPSGIDGAERISGLWWFTQDICPWWFLQYRRIENLGPEKVTEMRGSADSRLGAQLKEWGF
jgi:hypothetical protein